VIKEKLERYVQILNNIEDDQDKFMWIMDFGKNNPGLHDQYKLKCFEVPGCQSQTWLVPHFLEDSIVFTADSAALISKGMVCMLADVFSGATSDEIKAFETKWLDGLKLEVLLTPGRNNGVYSMLKKIQHYARKQD
jgi:cysteine desulfuration protein SufE